MYYFFFVLICVFLYLLIQSFLLVLLLLMLDVFACGAKITVEGILWIQHKLNDISNICFISVRFQQYICKHHLIFLFCVNYHQIFTFL